MSSTTLSNALSGLFASRAGLSTASNNISNANTEGYSRQTANFAQLGSLPYGSTFIGLGVSTSKVSRGFADLQNQEIARTTATTEGLKATQSQLVRVDTLIAASGTGLNDSFADFFGAAQDLSVRPTDIVARNSFLSRAQNLVSRFNSLDGVLNSVRDESTSSIKDSVGLVNQLSAEIASLNQKIQATEKNGPGSGDNALLDQRDLAVSKLSEQVEINRVIQDDGKYAVFMKNGQPLVTDGASYELQARQSPSDETEVEIGVNARIGATEDFVPFTKTALGSGRLGGLIDAQQKVAGYKNDLGLLSVRFSEEANKITTSGFDVDGNPGKPLFTFFGSNTGVNGYSKVSSGEFNSDKNASLTVTSTNSPTATGKEFEIYKDAGVLYIREKGSFTKGDPVTDLGGGNYDAASNFQFSLSGSIADGDSFVVAPYKSGAENLRMNITDPYDVVTSNVAGVAGDNGAIANITDLQSKVTMFTGTPARGASFVDAFSQLVNKVGDDKRLVDTNLQTQSSLLDRLNSEKDQVVGVNMDEEAASLIKFQQSYQAASQVLSVEKKLFEGFISAF